MKVPKPRAMLIDLDDTILAFSAGAELCWERVCHESAEKLNGPTASELKQAIDNRRHWYWATPERHHKGRMNLLDARREIVTMALNTLGIDAPDYAIEIADMYSELRIDSVELFPGAIDAIKYFRSCGIKLAMVTNGSATGQRYKIEKHGLAPLFDYILIEGEFGVGKPDARVYHHALAQLDAHASESWIIGDNLVWEVEVPQRLGLYTVWNDFAQKGLPQDTAIAPDRIIHRLSDLIALFQTLNP